MQVSQPNDVKIYNLSAGKSLPEVGVATYFIVLRRTHTVVSRICGDVKAIQFPVKLKPA